MKVTPMIAAFAATVAFAHAAQARTHQHFGHHDAARHRFARRHAMRNAARTERGWRWQRDAYATEDEYQFSNWGSSAGAEQSAYHHRLGGRPAAWCGWEMRQLVGRDPGPAFNLARNWARWGQAGPAGIGAVVVWPHHVGKIVGRQNGKWIIESGNDGHRLRTRPRSIAGVIAIRWG